MTFVYSHTRAAVRVAGTGQFSLSKAIGGPGALALRVSAVAIMAVGSVQPASADKPPAGQFFGYSVLSEVMRDEFATLPERLGIERFVAMTRGGGAAAESRPGISVRIDGVSREIDANGNTDTTNPISEHEWEHRRGEVAAGVDMPVPAGGGTVLLGASVHAVYNEATAHAFSVGRADIDATGLGFGVGAAFFAEGGFYIDLQGRVSIWDTDLEFQERVSKSVDGLSGGLSLEAGSRIGLAGGLALTPRIQMAYTNVDFDRFTDRTGVVVRQMDSDSLVLGAGALVEFAMPKRGVSVYGDLSASWDVLADSSIDASGLVVKSGLEDVWGKLAIGAAIKLGEGASAYLQGDYGTPLDELFRGSFSYGATAGIRMDF
jgi:outer membrane autotransporter protein